MSAKAILVFCAQALLVQGIYSQCAGPVIAEEYSLGNGVPYGAIASPLAYGPGAYSAGYGANIAPTSGGGFAVTSTSPLAPTGITVISENAIEGALAVAGELPFLSAVAVEGALPTAGAGGINYGCGNGAVGITSEGIAPAPAAYPGVGYGAAALGGLPYGPGIGYGPRGLARGCGVY